MRSGMLLTGIVASLSGLSFVSAGQPNTAFKYQGQLKQFGQVFDGTCDFSARLFDSLAGK